MSATDSAALRRALEFQGAMLEHVSRTFALTIPELPGPLRRSVTNAYLLCRIADTIEDDHALDADAKREHSERFIAVLAGREAATAFSAALAPRLSAHTPEAERELIARTDDVITVTHSLPAADRSALERCVTTMSRGMWACQSSADTSGLATVAELDQYCYYVAGVVGEMLTELYCSHSPDTARHRDRLMALAPSFGQGLQMTNILKDMWEDRRRGVCWLPREVFTGLDGHPDDLLAALDAPAFREGLRHLVGIARGHLANARDYTLLVPGTELGFRRFCLWAIGLALLTLRNIHRQPGFREGRAVKVSRRSVRIVTATGGALAGWNMPLKALHGWLARGLPAPDETPSYVRRGVAMSGS